MRARSLALTLSVAANLALAAAFLLKPAATAGYFRTLFSRTTPSGNGAHTKAAPAARDAAPVADAVPFAWSAAESADAAGLVVRLRAAGFSPAVIRAIVNTVINQQFAERQRDLLRERMPPAEYWKNGRLDVAKNIQFDRAMQALNREREKLLRDVLGSELNRNWEADAWSALNRERQFGTIPQAKIDQFQKINADYNDLTQKVHEDMMGIMLPEDRAKLALLEKEKQADIDRLFTPEEKLEYELRNSSAANMVRNRAGRLDLSEEEFRALFTAVKAYQDAHPTLDRPQPGVAEARQQAMDTAFRTVLGEERYAELKRINEAANSEGNVEMLMRLTTRLNLPASTPAAVAAVQQDIQARANAVRANAALTLGERAEQLATLAQEADAKLAPVLGPRGLEAYRQNGGQWLNTLTQPPGRGRGGVLRGGVPID
jgi:hypothetical protein